jgi:hypothetical protein
MLIGKFTQVLAGKYPLRESELIDRTDDDFEILKVKLYEHTEFGQQGSLLLHYGGSKDFDWENYDSDSDWGASAYFFGFQNFLEFYTSPSRTIGFQKLVLYTPADDFTGHEQVIIDEFEYDEKLLLEDTDDFEALFEQLLGEKYYVRRVNDDSVEKYID